MRTQNDRISCNLGRIYGLRHLLSLATFAIITEKRGLSTTFFCFYSNFAKKRAAFAHRTLLNPNYSLEVATLTPGPMVDATTQERIY